MLNTKKTRLRGMTLIEVIIAMVIIILVTIIAYVGVNTSANLLQHGKELRDADVTAVSEIEKNRKKYLTEGAAVTDVIAYKVKIRENITDAEGNSASTPITEYEETEIVGVVTAPPGISDYNIYIPYFTTAPSGN